MASINDDERQPIIIYGKISDKIPFAEFAKILDRVSHYSTGKEKKAAIGKFFDYFRVFYKKEYGTLDSSADNTHGDSLFPLLRILLPTEDRARAAYGFKGSILGKILAKILGVENSSDGKKLISFKDPREAGPAAGDLSTIVYCVFEKRFSANAACGLEPTTITQLHNMLDKLSKARGESGVNIETQKKVLQSFMRNLTSLEAKWLVRILLKQMKLGLNTGQIFQCIHEQAKELYERNMDLEYVCQKLNDPNIPLVTIDVSLFSHVKPMLCTRMDIDGDTFKTHSEGSSPSKIARVQLPTPPFYVENKWDGERFHIHYDGKVFKYFSRKGFDFTKSFDESLTPRLRPQIIDGDKSFILDGEMMAWNKRRQAFTLKGQNIDVKTMKKDNPNHVPVFVVYDILLLNGDVLTNTALRARREILNTVLTPKDDVVKFSVLKTISSSDEVMNALNEAIDNLEEGIVIKEMNSVYEPCKRAETWLKIKPEYVDGSSPEDLDLLILGLYYSDSSSHGGELTHFLVGLMQDYNTFLPLTTVGAGRLKNPEIAALVESLRKNLVKTEIPSVKFKGRKRPDWFVDPKKSVVVQVKATEIIPNDKYELKYTLRFPRITKVREDKSWNEVMTVEEFHRLHQAFSGKLAQRTDGKKPRNKFWGNRSRASKNDLPLIDRDDSDAEEEPKPGPSTAVTAYRPIVNENDTLDYINQRAASLKTQKAKLGAMGFHVGKTPTMNVQVNIFDGKLFCVYGSTKWKSDLETEILKYGGKITQNYVKDLFAFVGESETVKRIALAIRSEKYNVMKQDWILHCIEEKFQCQLGPEHFWFCLPDIKEKFKETHDEYGDSYTKEVSRDEMRSILAVMVDNQMKEEGDYESIPSKRTKSELIDEIFTDAAENRKFKKWAFLEEVKIAFRGEPDPSLAAQVEFFGGEIAKDEDEEDLTHVIVKDPSTSSKKRIHLQALVVNEKWLLDSIAKKRMLEEMAYLQN